MQNTELRTKHRLLRGENARLTQIKCHESTKQSGETKRSFIQKGSQKPQAPDSPPPSLPAHQLTYNDIQYIIGWLLVMFSLHDRARICYCIQRYTLAQANTNAHPVEHIFYSTKRSVPVRPCKGSPDVDHIIASELVSQIRWISYVQCKVHRSVTKADNFPSPFSLVRTHRLADSLTYTTYTVYNYYASEFLLNF